MKASVGLAPPPGPSSSRPAAPDPLRRYQRLGVAGVVLVLLAFGLFNALAVRPFFAGDETAHVNYALEVSSGRLPHFDDRFPSRFPGMRDTVTWTAMHPPLYYVLVAGPLRAGLDTGHPLAGLLAARLLTLLLAAGAVVATAALAAALLPRRPAAPVVAAGGLALVPSFQQLVALVYNDALALLTATAVLALVVTTVRHGCDRRRLRLLALAAAIAVAARASSLEVAALAVLAAATPPGPERGRPWRQRAPGALRRMSVVAVTTALPSAWFYLRNRQLYGSLDGSTRAVPPTAARGPSVLDNGSSPGFWLDQYRQLWGYVTTNTPIGGLVELLAYALLAAVLGGLGLAALRELRELRRGERLAPRGPLALAWLLMGVHAALVGGTVLAYFARGALPFGRYFFPLLPLLPVIAAVGLAQLPDSRRGLPPVAALLAAAGIGIGMTGPVLAVIDPTLAGRGLVGQLTGALAAAAVPAPALVLGLLATLLAVGLLLLGAAVVRLSAAPPAAAGR
ncbi:MAG: hypothetical protein M3P96_07780 [Actinomycetota bacterium]|nr:hypothetical protein [Actinomycetota bacterium]